jgi:isocitrate dehydrogenase
MICFSSFANTLEKACVDTIEDGKMTKDLAICIHGLKGLTHLQKNESKLI